MNLWHLLWSRLTLSRTLAWRSIAYRPWRSFLLCAGFGLGVGVAEDPASGSAAAALVGSLPGPEGVHDVAITQGVEMGRPSLIRGTATRVGGLVQGITIGGGAVVVGEGRLIRLP